MPTPFMHLKVAQEMLEQLEPKSSLRTTLETHWPAFCLGQIAADFQIICDVQRSKTHFYSVPPEPNDLAAFERMLAQYPQLAEANSLAAEHAVFIAGYGAHLLYDLLWFHNIVMIFAMGDWDERRARFMAHNALLAHEDGLAYQDLSRELGRQLLSVNPASWLPFDEDNQLDAWQTLVGEQLYPEKDSQTIQIYAERMNLKPEDLAGKLEDATWLNTNIFDHVSRQLLDDVFGQAVTDGLKLVAGYLEK